MQILTSPILLLSLLAVLLIGEIVLFFFIFRFFKCVFQLFKKAKGREIMGMLVDVMERDVRIEKDIKKIFAENKENREVLARALQKVSVVRFNPFGDLGGEQSFCVAFLDADDSGIVLTCLYSKDGTRTYIKQIITGKSEHSLSQEEKKVIKEAITKVNDK